VVEPGEQALFDGVTEMLSDRGYLLPLAAAQRQFRDAYYGMSAAALLEDLFFDAFSSYLRQYRPGLRLERPERGQRGWDYQFQGTQVSHKVGQGPTEIAALWDATRTDVTTWSFDSAVLFTSSDFSPKRLDLHVDGGAIALRPIAGHPDEPVKAGRSILALRWESTGAVTLLGAWEADSDTTVTALVPFPALWAALAGPLAEGASANTLEVLHASTAAASRQVVALAQPGSAGADLTMTAGDLRPGLYLLAKDLLQDVPVSSNNRAVLVAKSTVAALMRQAVGSGLFTPLPTWFAAWAPVRPPNLYLTQRAQYDQMFSGL
jgi:hypothetical protein